MQEAQLKIITANMQIEYYNKTLSKTKTKSSATAEIAHDADLGANSPSL